MEFDLSEIGITLVVGAFTILTIELICHYVFGRPLTGFFKDRLGLHGQNETHVAVFLALCYACGLFAEDVFSAYVAVVDFSGLSGTIICNARVLGDLEHEEGSLSRASMQTAMVVAGSRTKEPKITGLGRDMLDRGIFSTYDGKRGTRVEQWLQSPKLPPLPTKVAAGEVTIEDVETSAQRLWYLAKNRVYREPNYYDELKQLRRRQDLARTIATVAFIGALAMFFLSILMLLFLAAALYREGAKKWLDQWFGGEAQEDFRGRYTGSAVNLHRFAWGTLVRTLSLLVIYFFALWAYSHETIEFNKRTYGYFTSLTLHEQIAEARQ
jgi:hypothetical protein